MNDAKKSKLANILTALALIVATVQSFLTAPPFTTEQVFTWGAVLTYLTLAVTTWKQYLSPDVANVGGKITIWIAIVVTVAGIADLLHVFNLPEITKQYIKWGITVAVALVNIMSKTIFPSEEQKDKMEVAKSKNTPI